MKEPRHEHGPWAKAPNGWYSDRRKQLNWSMRLENVVDVSVVAGHWLVDVVLRRGFGLLSMLVSSWLELVASFRQKTMAR